MSLNAVLSCSDSGWTSAGVVWILSLLAPCLAPPDEVSITNVLPNEKRRLFQSAILLVAA
jgi:hypothetical protein